jgi:hypothetical protein
VDRRKGAEAQEVHMGLSSTLLLQERTTLARAHPIPRKPRKGSEADTEGDPTKEPGHPGRKFG